MITLDEAKAYLNLSADNIDDDDEIQAWIDAVIEVVEAEVGPCEPRTYTHRVRAGADWWLPRYPVIEITTITPIGTAGAVAVDDLDVDPATGQVTRLDGGCSVSLTSTGRWTVTYTAGREEIPANITRAALMILKHLWTNQRGSGAGRNRFDATTEQPLGFPWAVPKAALDLLRPHSQAPTVA